MFAGCCDSCLLDVLIRVCRMFCFMFARCSDSCLLDVLICVCWMLIRVCCMF